LLKSSRILKKLPIITEHGSLEIVIPALTKLSKFLYCSPKSGNPNQWTGTTAYTISYIPDIIVFSFLNFEFWILSLQELCEKQIYWDSTTTCPYYNMLSISSQGVPLGKDFRYYLRCTTRFVKNMICRF